MQRPVIELSLSHRLSAFRFPLSALMLMLVYLLRHALAGERGDPKYPDDSLRPLTDEGRRKFRKAAKRLAKRDIRPEIVATSPYVRCQDTALILVNALPPGARLEPLDQLQPGADWVHIQRWLAELKEVDEVALVGHAPDVEDLLNAMIGASGGAIRFAKGACACVEFDTPFDPSTGRLRWFVTAKLLGA